MYFSRLCWQGPEAPHAEGDCCSVVHTRPWSAAHSPSRDMPTARHFCSLQCWQRFRLVRSIRQFFWRGHEYAALLCWLLLKKPCMSETESDKERERDRGGCVRKLHNSQQHALLNKLSLIHLKGKQRIQTGRHNYIHKPHRWDRFQLQITQMRSFMRRIAIVLYVQPSYSIE